MSITTRQFIPTTTTVPPGGVSIIPPEEDPAAEKSWFEENLVVAIIVIVSVVLFLATVIIFYCIRKKRQASKTREVNINETESQTATSPDTDNGGDNDKPTENMFAESFVIITSPNLHNHSRKRKSTLAVPPAFSVSNTKRKSAPSAPVGWTRWSTAGLEIHTSPHPGERENPMPKSYARKKRQSMPGIMMAVPVVYRGRAVSHGQRHAVYVQENSSSRPPRPSTP